MKKIVIFDLDGTLMNIEHRMHFIKETPKDYHAFYKACSGDTPIPQVVTMFMSVPSKSKITIFFIAV
jgi:phosphoglycolate phosphatase-like HAD superfamily hydrolase